MLRFSLNKIFTTHDRCFNNIIFTLTTISILNIHLILAKADLSLDQAKYLIGVHPERRVYYQANNNQFFKCLDGSGSIPFDFVNDNYCDCRDASDEPGTPACPYGRFFCANEGYLQRLIPSAWVNDGQCDCCDASDEYNSTVRCENLCQVLGVQYRMEQEEHREMSNRGSAIRRQYKEEAKQRKEQNSQLLDQYKRELSEKENAIKKLEEELNFDFGPANVFFPLKGKCFTFSEREYVYTLCPFDRAAQESTSGMQTELGRWSGWAGVEGNVYSRQKYEGGIQCWNGPARSALINIACGVEDKIISVVEPAKCEYVYSFITPAACPDLDPPEEPTPEVQDQQVVTPNPAEVAPSLEVEDDPIGVESTSYLPNSESEQQDDSTEDGERHDEL